MLKGLQYVPRVIVTDKLKSCAAAKRERHMQRFKSPGQAQRFLSAHGPIHQHFRPRRHRMAAAEYRAARAQAFAVWQEETCVRQAA